MREGMIALVIAGLILLLSLFVECPVYPAELDETSTGTLLTSGSTVAPIYLLEWSVLENTLAERKKALETAIAHSTTIMAKSEVTKEAKELAQRRVIEWQHKLTTLDEVFTIIRQQTLMLEMDAKGKVRWIVNPLKE